ncbi:MAG: DMT family transporter [Anaerolineae bacterium]|jgi:drug/metabolite transporter (DMT)-like permease
MTSKPLPYILLLGSLFGSSLVVSRFSLGEFDARAFVSLRLILASLAHLLFYLLSRSRSLPRDPSLWFRASVLGVFGTAAVMTSIVSSLQYLSSGVSSLLLTLNPVAVVLLAHLFLPDERLTGQKIFGILIALGGATALLVRGETGLGEFVQADWRGYALTGLALFFGAWTTIFAHRTLRTADAFDVASIRMFSACLILIPVVVFSAGYDLSNVTWRGYLALAYGGLIGGFAAFLLSFYILKRFGATVNSMATYVIPMVSTLLGVLFLDELVTPWVLLSMVLILAGVWLLNRRPGE